MRRLRSGGYRVGVTGEEYFTGTTVTEVSASS